MAAASSELLTGWCLFGLSLLAILAFCWVYVRKYQSRRESEVISTITAIFALAIALITSALLPVDIFLVSYMKNQNGTFKEWADANVTRQIEDTVLYGYYTLYSIILFSVFLWIPFVYFYYEEKDEDDTNTCSQVQTALKYTLGFLMVCTVLLIIGHTVQVSVFTAKFSSCQNCKEEFISATWRPQPKETICLIGSTFDALSISGTSCTMALSSTCFGTKPNGSKPPASKSALATLPQTLAMMVTAHSPADYYNSTNHTSTTDGTIATSNTNHLRTNTIYVPC